MFDNKELLFGLASVIINSIGYYPYIKGILKGSIKPQRITWGIWSILTSIAFINQILNGGGYSSYFFGSTALLVICVFILSFKKGVGGKSKLDIFSLVAAVVLFALWVVTRDTRLTTIIAVAIDTVGALPTVLKAYKQPDTEAYAQWILAAVAGLLSTLAIVGTDYILFIYPLYIIFMNSIIVLAKYVGTARQKSTE